MNNVDGLVDFPPSSQTLVVVVEVSFPGHIYQVYTLH